MRISKREEPLNINVDNRELENMMHFKYLGNLFTKDASYTKEIRATGQELRMEHCTVWSRAVGP